MSLPRFFLDDQVLASEGEEVFPLRLSKDDAKHARVLRLASGEHIAVVDAARDYFECEIVEFTDVIPFVKIARHLDAQDEGASVLLIQGLPKGDKLETVIRHATEIGVAGFVPMKCSRSIVKLDDKKAKAKQERWASIAKSAAMQSGRAYVPEVTLPKSLKEVCSMLAEATAVLICWEEAPGTASLKDALNKGLVACGCDRNPQDARVAVVVGPEGGLTEDEVRAFLNCNPRASLVTLGSSILRTETAGLIGPALAIYELGGLGSSYRGADAEA